MLHVRAKRLVILGIRLETDGGVDCITNYMF